MADEVTPGAAPAAPAQAQTQAQQQTPPAAPPDTTTMLLTELTTTRVRLAELEQAERTRQSEAARKEQDLLAEKGNTEAAKQALQAARDAHERELAAERGKLAETDRRSRTAFRDRELALALSGKGLVDGAAPQLMKLLRDNLEAHPEGDGYEVRTPTFVKVDAFVAAELAKPEYAHFLRATSTGGGGASGGNVPAATQQAGGGPATLEDRRTLQLRQSIAAQRSGAPGLAGTYSNN